MFNIFKSKPKQLKEEIDLSVLKTDIHSHLIPNVDDGSQTMEESIYLLKQLRDFGYQKIITTPHIYYNSFPEGVKILDEKIQDLNRNAKFEGVNLEVVVGGEHLLDDDIMGRVKNNELKTFGNNYLLIEFPMNNEPMGYEQWLFDLQLAGFNLILAHPERFLYFYHNKGSYEGLKDRGILFQMNIPSISGYYGDKIKEVAEYLIDKGMVELLGTDTHGQRHIDVVKKTLRCPYLKKIIESGKLINNTL